MDPFSGCKFQLLPLEDSKTVIVEKKQTLAITALHHPTLAISFSLQSKAPEAIGSNKLSPEGAPGPQFSCGLSSSPGSAGGPALTKRKRTGKCYLQVRPPSSGIRGFLGKDGEWACHAKRSLLQQSSGKGAMSPE